MSCTDNCQCKRCMVQPGETYPADSECKVTIQRYNVNHINGHIEDPNCGYWVKYNGHLAEVAKLTEENERLRKVAEQAIFCGALDFDPNGKEIRSPTRTTWVPLTEIPELYTYLQNKENQTMTPSITDSNPASRINFELWKDSRSHWTDAFYEAYCVGVLDERIEQKSVIRALEAKVAEREWQPIETAPKDGTQILVTGFYCQSKNRFYEAAEWNEVTNGWWNLSVEFAEANCLIGPTHWMPLPTPPTQEAPNDR